MDASIPGGFLLSAEPPVRLNRPKGNPDSLETVVGSPLVLEVEVSRATAEVTWQVNGREVEEGGNLATSAEGLVRRLTVQSAAVEDSGSYSCRADEDRVDFQVHVSGTMTHQRRIQLPVKSEVPPPILQSRR